MGIQRRDISGNAGTATKLRTERQIGGVNFDGTANITLPGVNATGNQHTTGNAATATASTTAPVSDASTKIATTEFVKRMFGGMLTNDGTDWNDIENTRPGFSPILKWGQDPNGPGANIYFHVLNTTYESIGGAENVTQLAIAYGAPGNQLWMRGRYNGTWSQWVQFVRTDGTNATGTWPISIGGTAAGVSTAGALNATAGATVGAVGTYALLKNETSTAIGPGTNHTVYNMGLGNSLTYANAVDGVISSQLPVGQVWKCMGHSLPTTSQSRVTLFLRIS